FGGGLFGWPRTVFSLDRSAASSLPLYLWSISLSSSLLNSESRFKVTTPPVWAFAVVAMSSIVNNKRCFIPPPDSESYCAFSKQPYARPELSSYSQILFVFLAGPVQKGHRLITPLTSQS